MHQLGDNGTAEQELADKTREIVLNRGKRRVDRARERLDLQTRELEALKLHTLPQERDKLALEVDGKKRQIDRLRREGETAALANDITVMSAEAEIDGIQAEQDALR